MIAPDSARCFDVFHLRLTSELRRKNSNLRDLDPGGKSFQTKECCAYGGIVMEILVQYLASSGIENSASHLRAVASRLIASDRKWPTSGSQARRLVRKTRRLFGGYIFSVSSMIIFVPKARRPKSCASHHSLCKFGFNFSERWLETKTLPNN